VTTAFAIIRSARPAQWLKNALVFAPLIFAHQALEPHALLRSLAVFALFCLASAEIAFNVFGGGTGEKDKEGGHDPKMARKHTLAVFAWCIGFFALVTLFGFLVGVPLFLFLYLRPYAKEGWALSIIVTAVGGFCFWGLFIWLLNVHFAEGLVQQWLRVMGVT